MLVFSVVAVGFLASPALGALNASKAFRDPAGEVSDAQCYGHHREEGFRSMDLVPEPLIEVPAGGVFTFNITLVNPWLHTLLEPRALVNVSRAEGISFLGEKDPVIHRIPGVVAADPQRVTEKTFPLEVEENATEITLAVVGEPGALSNNNFFVGIKTPDGAVIDSPGARKLKGQGPTTTATRGNTHDALKLTQADVLAGGTGSWTAVVYFRGLPPEGKFDLTTGVYYNASRVPMQVVKGPSEIPPGGSATFRFQLKASNATSTVNLIYGGMGVAHNLHSDPNAEDYGNFTKWDTLTFAIGKERLVGTQVRIGVTRDAGPVLRSWGQALGFAGSILLIPALVFGGTFGPGSVSVFNRVLGPRRRVLWHNATSFSLLGVASIHMLLFLVEQFWNWSHGALWGGLALAAMIGLGVTGAMQKSFVARWGFERWRYVHFALGVAVVVFVLAHLVLDGTHFAGIREMFGVSGAN